MHRTLGALLLVTFLLPDASHASPINLIVNGSFEAGPAMDGPLCPIAPTACQDVDVAAGSGVIPGWSVFGISIDYLGQPWDVSDGIHAIDLDGRDAIFSGVSQTFFTTIGQAYQVSFDLSGNPGGESVKNVQASAGGFSQAYSFDTTGQNLGALSWAPISFFFTASNQTTTLSFMSLSAAPSSHGALIDNARVTALPEPSTLVLLATGAALGIRRRKRKVLFLPVR